MSAVPNNQLPHTADHLQILLVDDDEIYLQVVQRLLRRCHRYTYDVRTVTGGEEAIKIASTNTFDVLLIDYHLDGISGPECLNAMRAEQSSVAGKPPAILCTADGSESTAREALKADADDYLPKAKINANSLSRSIANVVTKHRLTCAVEQQFLELKEMNQQLEQKNREIGHFYQTMSHEVKTPLASAREFLSLVHDGVAGEVNPQQVEFLNYALMSCDQLTRHFDDLIDITRLNLKKLPINMRSCSIDDILKISVGSCASVVRERGGAIVIRKDISIDTINVDQDRIIQVLGNLVGNAVKYSDEQPQIEIGIDLDASENSIQFTVSDNGCGVSEEHASQIFDKLYQVGSAKVECLGAGLGLGLSIAKEIVSQHGGEIWMRSELGVGSTFYFTLPVHI